MTTPPIRSLAVALLYFNKDLPQFERSLHANIDALRVSGLIDDLHLAIRMVYLAPGRHMIYAGIHEFGGIIRAKNPSGYLTFRVRGQWVRVRQVRIRQKKYWRGATTSVVGVKIAASADKVMRSVK